MRILTTLLLGLLLGAAAIVVAQDSGEDPGEVLATVDGVPITRGDVAKALWDWGAPLILDELVDQTIILNAAKAIGVAVSDEELDARIEEMRKADIRPGMTFEETLRMQGLTLARLTSRVKMELLLEKLVVDRMEIPDSELDEVRARHILIRVQPSDDPDEREANEAEARDKAHEIYQRLQDGEDFAELAAQYSDDPNNKDTGGDLGAFPRGRMVKAFDDVVFNLQPDEIGKPFRTSFGYHIVQALEVRPGADLPAEEKAERIEQIKQQRARLEIQKWFQEHKAAAEIKHLEPLD